MPVPQPFALPSALWRFLLDQLGSWRGRFRLCRRRGRLGSGLAVNRFRADLETRPQRVSFKGCLMRRDPFVTVGRLNTLRHACPKRQHSATLRNRPEDCRTERERLRVGEYHGRLRFRCDHSAAVGSEVALRCGNQNDIADVFHGCTFHSLQVWPAARNCAESAETPTPCALSVVWFSIALWFAWPLTRAALAPVVPAVPEPMSARVRRWPTFAENPPSGLPCCTCRAKRDAPVSTGVKSLAVLSRRQVSSFAVLSLSPFGVITLALTTVRRTVASVRMQNVCREFRRLFAFALCGAIGDLQGGDRPIVVCAFPGES
jgi:hypothetical protein